MNTTLQASMEAFVLYPNYYRLHGIRRAVQLVAPPLRSTDSLILPKESILHSIPEDEAAFGIPQDDILLKNSTKIVQFDHVTQLAGTVGNPRPTRIPSMGMIREYHRKNRMTRWLRNRDIALRDVNTVLVENYGLLSHLYRYPITFLRSYYKWQNIQTTMWSKVAECAVESNRQQYIVMRLPKMIPSRQALLRASNGMNRTVLKQVGTPDTLFLLEVWKWIGEQRAQSLLLKAGEGIKNVNLIILDHGQWTILNLGLLDSWREPLKSESNSDEHKPGLVPPKMLQNRFLRLMAMMADERAAFDTGVKGTVAVPEDKPIEPPPGNDGVTVPEAETRVKVANLQPIKIDIPPSAADAEQKNPAIRLTLKKNQDIEHLPDHPVEETPENIQKIEDAIDKELKVMDEFHEEIYKTQELDLDESEPTDELTAKKNELRDDRIQIARDPFEQPVIEFTREKKDYKQSFIAKVDGLADMGAISAAEYRRLNVMAGAYEKLPDPYGSGESIAKAMVIQPELLKIDHGTTLPKTAGVFDKSMQKSSLEVFDKHYVQNVMKKDIMKSVVALQSAGIAVTGYSVEETQDALGEYQAHTVQLTPAQGRPATIHFKIPKVDEDGTYQSNGIRYRQRKQRRMVPIVKVAPNKVALTSYYAKTFVSRSERQVFNYPDWLCNQIAAKGIDASNPEVTEAMLANVYDSNWKVPRIYSTLAMRFRSFTIGDVQYFFDYDQRFEHFGEEAVKAVEKDGMVVMGRNLKTKALITVDRHNQRYAIKGDKVEELGLMEMSLNLNGRPPMEIAELKVFGKQIPLGICLGYLMGFSNLLKLTKIKPRTLGPGERVSLMEDEFAIRFEDTTLIFSRENPMASLVFGGFQSIEESTRNYPIHLFDKKDIYLNALQPQRIGLRFLKELDLEHDLFIDPITEEVLAEMKEPTQYSELLLRACELLVDDHSPDEADMASMRITGYERVAGIVYGEMAKAIRLYRARGAAVNAKIEIPPYAIWQAITQDPAVKLVEESNPIHNLKEKEEVTYSGTGGRSGRSMTKATRLFHPNDVGVISEATKDSADVSITTFMTADPNLKNLRGLTNRIDHEKDGPASMVSTSALISPAADRDDAKRV